MLTLTRKVNEEVLIGDDVVVEVIDIRGSFVRLGFKAPDSVTILRSELKERVDGEEEAEAYAGDGCEPQDV